MPWKPQELEAARHLLYHYGQPGGWEPGSFTKQLIRTLEHADHYNRNRLLGAFPEFKPAVQILITQGSTALANTITSTETTP